MPAYQLNQMFKCQFVGASSAALPFAIGAATSVPAKFAYQLGSVRVTNVTNAPVSLTVWRVESGAAADAQHTVTPATVNVPVASNTFPHFDLTVLWGAVLGAGDAIWAQAGSASALVIQGDGAVIQN